MLKWKVLGLVVFFSVLFLPACQMVEPPEPTPEPTPTPIPPKELSICLGYEPASLYPLAAGSQAARDVLQAIYDGPVDLLDGQPVPVILERLPDRANGGVTLTPLEVRAGDEVINTAGQPVALRVGTRVFPSGCGTPACAIQWDGTAPLLLDQPAATFRLKPGLAWSDGQPLTASDALFGYRLAADPDSPTSKQAVDQTADYRALDDWTVEWVGVPGLVTDAYERYFWMPLPEHAWGETSAAGLLEAEESTRRPLGWGAYRVAEWLPGEEIHLERNPFYFRASEGLPYFDLIHFKIIRFNSTDDIRANGSRQCDIIAPSAAEPAMMISIGEEEQASDYQLNLKPTSRVDLLAIGITPASYDQRYYPYGEDRPDIFGDVRVRQAIAHCIDRAEIGSSLYGGLAAVSDSFLHPEHPLLGGVQLPSSGYNPERGQALLEVAGWMDVDQNPATPRASFGTARIPPASPLQVELVAPDGELQTDLAMRIAVDLAACGIGVTVTPLPVSEIYQPAPEGPVFGRAFDMALMTWDAGKDFSCDWFTSAEIPNEANNWMGQTTGGWNFMGYSSADFDVACDLYKNAGTDADLRRAEAGGLLRQLSTDLPIIPLFHHADPYLVKKNLSDLKMEFMIPSVFKFVEEINFVDNP